MSDNGTIEDLSARATQAHAPGEATEQERAITAARVVVVGPMTAPGVTAALEELAHADIGPVHLSETVPSSDGEPLWRLAQPHQLWLVTHDEGLAASVADLGATVVRSTNGDELRSAVLGWMSARCRASEAAERNLVRENTILRRELNRALSVLGPAHQVLGLMPSVTIDQFRAERRPIASLQPENPQALMARRGHALATPEVEQLEREVAELREHVAAIERTRVMRWSRLPRSVYRRLRQQR